MIVVQHGLRVGRLRTSLALARSFCVLLAFACLAGNARAQLKVGQPIDFGSTPVGNAISINVVFSAVTATTVTSAGALTDGAVGADFTLGANSCTGTIPQNGTCSVNVTFTPRQVGVRHGVLQLYNGSALANQVFLHGIGTGGAFAFAPANVTANASAPGLAPATFTAGSSVQDGYGNIYFTDVQNGRILEQTAGTSGTISQVATLAVNASSTIAIGADGTLFVSAQSAVYAFQPGATPTPLATGSITLTTPTGLAVDAIGDLYIADASTGQLSVFSLSSGTMTAVPVSGLTPAFSSPHGLAVDASSNLYVADSGNDRIVEVAAGTGRASVVAEAGLTLNNPTGLTLDPAGTIYVADTGNGRICEITVNAVAFALTDPNLALKTPTGVLMKPNGDLIVADNVTGLVLVPRSIPAVNFPTPTLVGTLDSTDGAIALSLQATGNTVTQLVFPTSGTEPTLSSGTFALTNAGSCPSINQGNPYTPLQFSIGDICTYTIDFTPAVVGLNTATLEVDISQPGGSPVYTTKVPLSGIGISSIASFTLVAAPGTTTLGAPVSLTLTAVNATGGVAADYTGTVTFTSTDPTSQFLSGTTFTFTSANRGVLTIPAAAGVDFNQRGTFFVHATDGTFSATSNPITVLDASTVSSFTSSVNPSLPNQTTTLIATVATASPGGPVPTGTVSFYNAGVLIGTAKLLNGVAQLDTSFAAPGTYPLTAVYNGDNNTAPSSPGSLNQVVVFVTTATSFTSSINPSLVGQSTVLTMTVSSAGPAPTGTVNFYDGATLIGTGTVASGVATVTVSFATVGQHLLKAVYSGDNNNATVSATLTQLVVAPVAIMLTSSINPSLVGQQTVLTVAVTSTNAPPTGTVQIFDGTTLLGTVTLANGTASLPATFTTVGIHALTAVYAGDANNVGQSSAPYAQDVVTPTLAVGFTSSVNPSQVGQNTTLTVTLAGTGTAQPTGTVTFYDGTTPIGTGTVVNGIATLTASFATVGIHPLTAVYSGDTNNAAVTAGPLNQIVVMLGTIVLSSSINPSLVNQSVTLTATLGTVTATGTVNFYDGTTLLGTGTIANGAATLAAAFSTVGIHSLTAVYSGDASNAGITSAPYAQYVVLSILGSSGSNAVLTSSVNPSLVGQSTTFTLTLTTTGPAPTGTVKFYSGKTLLGTGTIANGIATLASSFAAPGSYPITAVYSGDSNYATLTAGPLAQIVVSSSTVILTSSINPSLVNQSTVLTAFLGSNTAGGSVSFYDGTTLLGTSNVVSGTAPLVISFSTVGIHTLTAVYSGDLNDPAATSLPYAQDVVTPTLAASFTSSVNPSNVGQSTVLTVTLTGTGASQPTGTVTFYDGTTPIGIGTVVNGVATLAASFATVGIHPLTAVYSGDTTNAAITAGPLHQIVVTTGTIVLSSSINPSLVNQSVTLTAGLGTTTATGTVNFYDGTTLLGTGTVANGAATLAFAFTTTGVHTLTAVYSGDASNAGITSAPYAQDVVLSILGSSGSNAVLTSSVNPSNVGQSTTFTLTLTTTGPAPTGSVNFYSGTTLLGTGTIANGIATLASSFAAPGNYPISAVYSGDINYATLTAGPLAQIVVSSSTVILTSSVNPSLVNQNTTLTAFIGSNTASGSVAFYNGTTLMGSGNVSNGVASIIVSFPTAGVQTLTAAYSGFGSSPAATSAPYAQDVVTPTLVAGFTSSVNPSTVGQSTVLTVTLAGTGASQPTGTVKFYDGSTLIGTGNVINGVATLTASFATAGTHSLTAVYSGDGNNATITAGPLNQIVTAVATTVTLTSSVNPVLLHATTQLTATLSSATATNSVSFYDGTTLIGTAPVVGGSATLPASFSTVGLHPLKAIYSGDANDSLATSPIYTQDVQNPDSAALTTSLTPALVNQAVTLTATITSAGQSPAGQVQFYDGTTLIGTTTAAAGIAQLGTAFTTIGTHSLSCKYLGDSNDAPAACSPIAEVIEDPSSMTLTSSLNPSTFGQSVTLTASVTTAGPTPTGSISFYNGTTLLTTVTLAPGSSVATYATTTLPIGTDAIKAVYSGDNNTPTASAALSQAVLNPATIAFACPVSPLPINTSVTLSATVTSTGPAPTGTVNFFDGTTLLGSGKITNGVASISATFTTIGAHSITATYSGDANNGTVTSTACPLQVVDPATIALVSSKNPSVVGQAVTFTATIGSAGPTPTGTVSFFNGTTPIGTGKLGGGATSVAFTFTTQGTYPITAVYSGDSNTATVASGPLSQVVLNVATITLTSSVNPIFLNNQAILTATAASTGVTPTGLVTFYDGAAPIGNAALVNGVAALTVTFPSTGAQSLTAVYYGDPVTAPASSTPYLENVGDFSVAVATGTPSTASILQGGTATYSLVLTPLVLGTLPQGVGFTLTGLPKGATYLFTPPIVAAGSATTPFILTINTPAVAASLHGAPPPLARRIAPVALGLLLLPAAMFSRRRRFGARTAKRLGSLMLLLLLAAGATGLTGCITSASSGYYGVVPTTYHLTVTGTSQQLSRTTGITLTIQ